MVTTYSLVGHLLFQFTLQAAAHCRVLQSGLCWKDWVVSVPPTSFNSDSLPPYREGDLFGDTLSGCNKRSESSGNISLRCLTDMAQQSPLTSRASHVPPAQHQMSLPNSSRVLFLPSSSEGLFAKRPDSPHEVPA